MNQEYIDRLQKIEAELARWLPETAVDWSGFEAVKFSKLEKVFCEGISNLNTAPLFAPITDMISRGGKRWRPLLMTLVCDALGGRDAALPLTPIVEFSHNASLIHDDIEDESEERRGKPAIHHLYGMDAAINSGSFLYFLSLCCIDSYYGNNKDLIYKTWGGYMRRLHLGQAMDIFWHNDITHIPSLDDYYTMCGMKTGSLSALAAELGALAAGVSGENQTQKLGEAAMKLGIGFQILDDVKNLTNKIPGKKHGDDIVEGKKSLPVLLYLNSNPHKKERVFYCFYQAKKIGHKAPEVQELIDILNESGVFSEAEEKAHVLINEAREIFNAAGAHSKLINGLIDLIS